VFPAYFCQKKEAKVSISVMEMPESGVKSREISILKEFFKYD